jgi:hypothetical protein
MLLETVFLFAAAAVMAVVARAAVREFYATTAKKCDPDAVSYFERTSAEWAFKRAVVLALCFALEPLLVGNPRATRTLCILRYVAGAALVGCIALAYRYAWIPVAEINAAFRQAYPAAPPSRPLPQERERDVEQH